MNYDPAFTYELAVIIQEGIRRMYQDQENIFYYITVTNENYKMPVIPKGDHIIEGILKGIYCFKRSTMKPTAKRKAHLFGSGAIMTQVLSAQKKLEDYGVCADVWSVTSYSEINRDALDVERWNMLNPDKKEKQPYIDRLLQKEKGVFVATSDYMKALPNSIKPWIPHHFIALGTDGYGLSETRSSLRTYFEVSSNYIVWAVLTALYKEQKIKANLLKRAKTELEIDSTKKNPMH